MTSLLEATEVIVPKSREEAVAAFGDGSGVTVVAGGTIVMPDITYGRVKPARALVLCRSGMAEISRDTGHVRIGAMATVAALEQAPEPLAASARQVADPEIRAQATLGGNLCAPPGLESPRGDLQAALIALGAEVRSIGAGAERTEPIEDFLEGGPDRRLVLEVEFSEPQAAAQASVRRPHAHAYTIMSVCVARLDGETRVGVSGAGPRAVRCRAVERSLSEGASAEEAAQRALDDVTPQDDALASAWYRRKTLPVVVRRALTDLSSEEVR